jgi:hypothetical protein
MNPTPPTPESVDSALVAAAAGTYTERSRGVVSGGAKTASFEDAVAKYAGSGDMLHGDLPPAQVINKEQPIHVLMCYMLASGKTVPEIAAATNYAVASVRNIERQPWFRKRYLSIVREKGGDTVKAFLDTQVMPSLEVLVEIRDANQELRPHVSAAAANSILDRALGKAVQQVQTENHNFEHGKTVDEVDAQLNAVTQELKSRGHGGVN